MSDPRLNIVARTNGACVTFDLSNDPSLRSAGYSTDKFPRETHSQSPQQQHASGEPFSEQNLGIIRPSEGLEPKHYRNVLGKSASQDIARTTPLRWDLIA